MFHYYVAGIASEVSENRAVKPTEPTVGNLCSFRLENKMTLVNEKSEHRLGRGYFGKRSPGVSSDSPDYKNTVFTR